MSENKKAEADKAPQKKERVTMRRPRRGGEYKGGKRVGGTEPQTAAERRKERN